MTYKEQEAAYIELRTAMEKQILEIEVNIRHCGRAKVSGKPSLNEQAQIQSLENGFKTMKFALLDKIDIINDELEHIK